ncbi:MAG: hypothetical protein ACFFCU_20610 [Promethearchaeota archaeon]
MNRQKMYKNRIQISILLFSLFFTNFSSTSIASELAILEEHIQYAVLDEIVNSAFNGYTPDGNSSVLLCLDSNLLGEDKYFTDELIIIKSFKSWLKPFEKRFNLTFHIKTIKTYKPGEHDNLTISMTKVTEELSWKLATSVNDENVEGNGADWLLIYQENYQGGRNHVNSIKGNALIIAHNQLLYDKQLILLHEVGHLFGGRHDGDGKVPLSYYGEEEYSIMDYDDLLVLDDIWDGISLPLDENNFHIINNTKYRFDLKDPEQDGLPNYYEYRYNFNPTANDSEEDRDSDGLMNIEEYQYGTNPVNWDSDQDNYSDWAERFLKTSPLNSSDIPEVEIPIIIAWTNQTSINEGEEILLSWRGISSNPDHYKIYQNGSLIVHASWDEELIQYQSDPLTSGFWNYTCVVLDSDGDKSSAEILLRIHSVKKTPLIILGPLLAMIYYRTVHRKKIKKNNKNS